VAELEDAAGSSFAWHSCASAGSTPVKSNTHYGETPPARLPACGLNTKVTMKTLLGTRARDMVEEGQHNPQGAPFSKAASVLHRSLKPYAFEASRRGETLVWLTLLTGRRPTVTIASKGVAALGIRAGARCGALVTLRLPKSRTHRLAGKGAQRR
jgi:hypothetical protein